MPRDTNSGQKSSLVQAPKPDDGPTCVNVVLRDNLLLIGRSDARESRASHLSRLRYIARGVAMRGDIAIQGLTTENKRQKAMATLLSDLSNRSRMWVCERRLGCRYGG